MQSYDVIVAGLGAMGSAALDHLAGRGVSALGIEPADVPNLAGSSTGDTRLIRKAYFEHPDYVPLLDRAYQNWRELESDAGERLLYQTGTLYLGHAEAELVAGSRHSAAAHGLLLESLTATELQRRFPGFRCPDDYVALFEPDAGFLLCERAVNAQMCRAGQRGGHLARGERLLRWRAVGSGVEVTTDRSRYTAGGLVLTAGAWSAALLGDLDIELRVTRQPLFWLQPEGETEFRLGDTPCWAVQRPDAPGLYYGFPSLPSGLGVRRGVKVAHHAPGEPTSADAVRRPAEASEFEAVLGALAPFLPGLRGTWVNSHVCVYTSSADGHFVVDGYPGSPQVVFACGFSGHGFKFASVMGELLADLVLTGRTELPAAFLRRRVG